MLALVKLRQRDDSQQGLGLNACLDLSENRSIIVSKGYTSNLPRAAVFKVPNGKSRSETGSQTNISPSRMMLKHNEMVEVWDPCTYSSIRESKAASM